MIRFAFLSAGGFKYKDTVTAKLLGETWDCKNGNVGYEGHLLAQALLNVKVESSFGFTLIVNKLTLPLDLSQSYLTFYNKGEVTGVKVIADIPFPGASSKIPGIATIGPQLVVKGGINARLSMSGTVETKLQIAKWNVRQVVPDNSQYNPELIDNSYTDLDRTGDFEGIKNPEFYAGVKVSGDVEVKLSAAAEFGIRFVERWKVEPAGAAIVGEATVTAGLTVGISTTGTCPFTYELDVGAYLFARVTAPDPFGIGWSGAEVTITEGKKNIFKEGTCPGLGPVPTRRALGIIEGGNTDDNDSALSTAYGGHLLPAL
ncbi:glycosyl hydrolase family 18 protein [Metarhizium anisopliae]